MNQKMFISKFMGRTSLVDLVVVVISFYDVAIAIISHKK